MRSGEEDGAFGGPRRLPWGVASGIEQVVESWRSDRRLSRCLVLDELLPAQPARESPLPEELAPAVRTALSARGIHRLYSHQARCVELALAGRDLVVATPTASGKSLCYNLPVLHALAGDREARALYLFPTKALSRDQEETLRGLLRDGGLEHGAITFDGDTPQDARRAARERSGIILSNPDMLHTAILPHHAGWARLFANLRYVVLDELHTYRGVFGSHVANVLRRLERVARFHGSSPRFLFASATIGNPREHASRMLGREVELVEESGAPRGARRVMVYQPPVVNPELGLRESYVKASAKLCADLVRAKVSTLLFGQSRNNVEVMLKYLRDRLAADRIDPELIHAYRGGYLPATRREIEAKLREGKLRCVVATNALELGIDVGALDAVVCAGYPGSMAALWQRFGRAGRRQHQSLALLVTSSAPVDQYVASEARSLLAAPIEEARIDPDNVEILVQHLKCAAFELPFAEGEPFRELAAASTSEALEYLASHRVLHPVGEAGRKVFHWAADAYPANDVSLRSVGWDNFVVVELESQKTIAEMDWRSAHTMLHEQAIYQHEGAQFQVERLDFENHKAFVRKVAPDYFTDAMTYTHVEVLSEASADPREEGAAFGAGEVSVVEKVVGYKKIKFHTHENVGYGEVALPEIQMHTTAFWMTAPEKLFAASSAPRAALVEAFRGIGNALHTVACVGLMIDPRDLGCTVGSRLDPALPPQKGAPMGAAFEPTLFLFDHVPGGVGLASRLFEQREALLRRGRRLVESCSCQAGCPGCIGPAAGAPSEERKALTISLFAALGAAAVQ